MKKSNFIYEIDIYELGVRMLEAACGLNRPSGMSGREAFNHFEGSNDKMASVAAKSFMHQAKIAATYFAECISKSSRVN